MNRMPHGPDPCVIRRAGVPLANVPTRIVATSPRVMRRHPIARLICESRGSRESEHAHESRVSAHISYFERHQTTTCWWLGRKDSNLQPSDPESAALPLRHSPIKRSGPAAYSSQPPKRPFTGFPHAFHTCGRLPPKYRLPVRQR